MDIENFVSSFTTHPVLFLGAGISHRYCDGTYTWENLLEAIAQLISEDDSDRLYLDLSSRARKRTPKGELDLPQLATLLSSAIDDRMGATNMAVVETLLAKRIPSTGTTLSEVNERFYDLGRNGNGTPRIKLLVKELLSSVQLKDSMKEEVELLKNACKKVASIVTTNYDHFIEDYLKFSRLIGNEILLSNPYQSVYKIHGSLDRPESIILTKEDYDLFNSRYELIQAQLISLFIHNPIIFIGYSIGDDNIRRLLSTVFSYVDPGTDLGKKFIASFLCVVYEEGSDNKNVVREDLHIERAGEHLTIPLNVLKTDNFQALYQAIASLSLPIEAIHLKRVESALCELKKGGGGITVKIAESIESLENRDLVFAIGSTSQISFADQVYTDSEAIEKYFDIMRLSEAEIVIVTKYIKQDMFFPAIGLSLKCPAMKKRDELISQQENRVNSEYTRISYEYKNLKTTDITRVRNIVPQSSYRWMAIFAGVYEGRILLDDLGQYLQQDKAQLGRDGIQDTNFRKLLCLYDMKKYGDSGNPASSSSSSEENLDSNEEAITGDEQE